MEETFKIVLIGDSKVGKSSIINRFIHDKFEDQIELSDFPMKTF